MTYSHVFEIIEFDYFKALVLQFINLQMTFIWTYNDLLVMLISTALAFRFSQITDRIITVAEDKVNKKT